MFQRSGKACLHLLLAICLCGLPSLTASAPAAERVLDLAQTGRGPVSLSEYFTVLEDASTTLTLSDVWESGRANQFVEVRAADALSFGFTRSAYWLRLHLHNSAAHSVVRMLEIRYPLLSDIQLHHPRLDGTYTSWNTGAATAFSTRPYPNRFFVFPITVAPQSTQVVYLRIQSLSSLLVPTRLWEPHAFYAYERDDYLLQAGYFGMATAIILFNLLLFVALKDIVYLLYIAFATGTALTIAGSNGFAKEFLWPEATWWSDIAISVSGSLTLAALLFLMRQILDTRTLAPRLDWLSKLFTGVLLLFPFGFIVTPQLVVLPSTLLVSAAGLLILIVCIYCAYFKHQKIAMFFLAAIIMWLFGTLLVSLKTLSLLPSNFWTMNGYQIGSALEMMLLAFVLAYRFVMIRRKASEDVQEANANLEGRLQIREAELKESYQRLREIENRQILSEERQRLMEDMHDGLGSSLTSALRMVERGGMQSSDVAQVLKACIDDLKLAIDSMESVDADLLLLLAMLRFRLGSRLEKIGIVLHWQVQDVPALDWLEPQHSLHILRILQEAFTNIIKHANATEVCLSTDTEAGGVTVTLTDNGRGFTVSAASRNGGRGLPGQTRRAQAIGAEIRWESDMRGTRLTLWLPVTRRVV